MAPAAKLTTAYHFQMGCEQRQEPYREGAHTHTHTQRQRHLHTTTAPLFGDTEVATEESKLMRCITCVDTSALCIGRQTKSTKPLAPAETSTKANIISTKERGKREGEKALYTCVGVCGCADRRGDRSSTNERTKKRHMERCVRGGRRQRWRAEQQEKRWRRAADGGPEDANQGKESGEKGAGTNTTAARKPIAQEREEA